MSYFHPAIEPNHNLKMIADSIKNMATYYNIPVKELLRRITKEIEE